MVVQKPLENNYIETLQKYGVGLFHAQNTDGSFRSNILEGIPRSTTEEFNVHCTVKPLVLMEKLIEMMVPPSPNNIVLDPFAGSGTTLLAAKNLGFPYIGMEINPAYAKIAETRVNGSVKTVQRASAPPETLGLFA